MEYLLTWGDPGKREHLWGKKTDMNGINFGKNFLLFFYYYFTNTFYLLSLMLTHKYSMCALI